MFKNRKIFLILSLLLFPIFAKAFTFDCEYAYKGYGNVDTKVTMRYDTTNGTMTNTKENSSTQYTKYSYSYNYGSDEIKALKTKESGNSKNQCPILYLSEVRSIVPGLNVSYTTIGQTFYTDSFIRQQENGDTCIQNNDQSCFQNLFGVSDTFYTLVLSNGDTNKDNQIVSSCLAYNSYMDKIQKAYSNYKNCINSNCYTYIQKANQYIDKIKDYCKQSLKYRDVLIDNGDGTQTQDECIKSCLSFEEDINDLKNQYGININDRGECGISNKLIIWLINIMRWVKYIIPVIVILLGILDFIRAVMGDKEDDMKKAQGRFVKRLIAAALIFIVPFILEFIIEKMGFNVQDCELGLFK